MAKVSPVLRWIFTWLVLLGVLASLHARASAADPCEVLVAMHEQEHSGHHHDPEEPCDPSHDQHCPLEHHQHSGCCHAMPLADAAGLFVGLTAPVHSLSRHLPECEVAPDGPCLSEDEPPLI